MKIGTRSVGINYPPLIIAEIGINHGGSLETAKLMVSSAFKAGAECVKHQTHFVDDEMTDEAKSIFPPNAEISIWDVISSNSLSKDDEIELRDYAESLGLIYLSTPFSRKAADFLNDINIPAFKIGSGEADNLPLIRHIAGFGKPVILSTGMQNLQSIKPSVRILEEADIDFALLECTNLYPSPPEIVSLQGVTELKNTFPDRVIGFSDHSIGPEIALASIALGASIIERHFTDSRYRKGPDISCSMDPAELKYLIDRSVDVHKACTNQKSRTEPEESVYAFARGSIVADRDLSAGTVIGTQDIWARRPGNGEIAAFDFDKIVGKKLLNEVIRNTQLKWSDLETVVE
jgi:sialic acid synthase SpsE